MQYGIGDEARDLAQRVESFVRETVIGYEADPRRTRHGPEDELVAELRAAAAHAGVLTPHIREEGRHLTQLETALVLRKTGISPLGPVACNTAAPDEGNMYLIGKVGTEQQKSTYLSAMIAGASRSAFFMTEPSEENGAGSDPSMLRTTAVREGAEWIIRGRKKFITGALGAKVGIVMAMSDEGPCLFLVTLPHPAVKIERILNTIDGSMPGGHAVIAIDDLRVPERDMLGAPGEGFRYAQVRLSPARLSHCMRWLGAADRAHEIAAAYACERRAFGKALVDHEGVGFMLAENLIELKQAELMIDWCASVLDTGSLGTLESSMTKVAVSEGLMRVADRCVQVMGGSGVTDEMRAFRIYDGPTEVHKWSIAKQVKRDATVLPVSA
jgi:acyl-CoA dehydrogenase